MGLDIGALVAPLSEDTPSGPDLFESPDRQVIESAFDRSISGDSSSDGAEVDWPGTIARILAQAAETRDLWLATYLMRAAAHSGQFELVVDGADFLATLVEERWADVHPQLDEVGFIGRKAPCESLVRIGEFLGPLQAIPLLTHPRLGGFTGRDLLRFLDEGSGADGFGMFRGIVEVTPVDDLHALLARIDRLLEAIRRTDRVLTSNAEGDTSTNFDAAYEVIERMRRALAQHLPGGGGDAGTGNADAGHAQAGDARHAQQPSTASAASGISAGFSGEIKNRDDVVRALDGICSYYSRFEPASPVPIVLRRAREWISLDFIEILEDIAPDSVREAATVLRGRRSENDSGDGWN